MRSNVVLNDDLLREAQQYSTAKTRRALLEEALRTYVEVKARERQRANYRERLRALDRRLWELDLRESPHCVLRRDRDRS